MRKAKPIDMKRQREFQGWTQLELAKRAKVNLSTVVALERGAGEGFSLIAKHRVADALGVPLFQLFPEEQQKLEELQRLKKKDQGLVRMGHVQMFIRDEVEKS